MLKSLFWGWLRLLSSVNVAVLKHESGFLPPPLSDTTGVGEARF